MDQEVTNTRELTAGEKAVGLTFNPSNNKDVQKIKELSAQIFDIVEGAVPAADGTIETDRKRKMRDAALHEIVTAQMWAVKVVTLPR